MFPPFPLGAGQSRDALFLQLVLPNYLSDTISTSIIAVFLNHAMFVAQSFYFPRLYNFIYLIYVLTINEYQYSGVPSHGGSLLAAGALPKQSA